MKRSITTILAVLAASATVVSSAYGQEASLRERLVNEKSVELLYSIDDFNTYVVGENLALSEKSGEYTIERRDVENGAVLIRHTAAQPLVYKSPVLPSYEELAAPGKGEIRFNSAAADGEFRDYTNLDLFQHVYAACVKTNGSPNFLIPARNGNFKRLTEVDSIEAFNYIVSAENEGGAWEFTCTGKERFLLSKEYRFANESFETASVYRNRGFEGMNFVKDRGIDKPAVAAREDSAQRARLLKQTAFEVANMKVNFVKGHNGSRYEGLYKANNGGCDLVSIRHRTGSDTKVRVYDYKVCNSQVTSLKESEEDVKLAKIRIHHLTGEERVIAKAE